MSQEKRPTGKPTVATGCLELGDFFSARLELVSRDLSNPHNGSGTGRGKRSAAQAVAITGLLLHRQLVLAQLVLFLAAPAHDVENA